MSKNFEVKKTVVADIKDKFDRAKCVVLVDYRGLTVAEDTALRNEFRKNGCEYAVLKNTMIDLKCGVCDGDFLDENGVKALADLPSKEVLIAKIMGSMMSAVSKFVYVVEAIRKQKAGEE